MTKKMLIITGYYLPSIKGGGPIQSIKNIVENFNSELEIYIITGDRDLGDSTAFPNITIDGWNKVGSANVFYINSEKYSLSKIKNIIHDLDVDIIYLNSFFSFKFSILPLIILKSKKLKQKRIVIAPRGEFSPGAFNLKRYKKNLYVNITKPFNFYKNIVWHATAISEKEHIEKKMGYKSEVILANNLTPDYSQLNYSKKLNKEPNYVKLVYISRIHQKKNLIFALQLLSSIKGNVLFNIYGPIEDNNYWKKCKEIIARLPQNISVKYHGLAKRNKIMSIFHENHFFFFPTLGENYGHVISESLIGACPLIISDETPWRRLQEKKVGWDISLDREEKFIEVLNEAVQMNQEEYVEYSKESFAFGKNTSNIQRERENYQKLFDF